MNPSDWIGQILTSPFLDSAEALHDVFDNRAGFLVLQKLHGAQPRPKATAQLTAL